MAPGECLGIIGESGSGKSVTALSLLGLVASPPGVITAGAVRLKGTDTLSMTGEQLRRVRGAQAACIFQDPLATHHPLYTVGDQMVEAIRAHRPVRRRDAWDHALSMLRPATIEEERDQRRAELEFHETLAGLSDNPLLGFVCGFLVRLLKELTICKRIYDQPNPELRERGVSYQEQLIEALCTRDAETARAVMQAHMRAAHDACPGGAVDEGISFDFGTAIGFTSRQREARGF